MHAFWLVLTYDLLEDRQYQVLIPNASRLFMLSWYAMFWRNMSHIAMFFRFGHYLVSLFFNEKS